MEREAIRGDLLMDIFVVKVFEVSGGRGRRLK